MSPSIAPILRTSKISEAAVAAATHKPVQRGGGNESKTVLRACEVLKAFRFLGEDLSLTDVIDRTRLPKTTVFRLLRTLVHGGLLERIGSGVYRNCCGPVTAESFRIGGRRTRARRLQYGR